MKFKRFLKGLKNQISVIDALVFRELLTKKNYSYLGFLGVIFEPLVITLIYLIIMKLIRVNLDNGMDLFLFFATGILIFSFFISIFIRSLNAIKANRNLFYYRIVKPIDTVIARTLIEIVLLGTVYSIIFSIVSYTRNTFILDNLPKLLLVFILVTIMAFSLGLLALVLGSKFELISNFAPLISRPLFFTSGAIFSVNIIPAEFRKFIIWNPLIHATELARNCLDNNYLLAEEVSLHYLSYITFISFGISIFVYQKNERYLLRK